MERRSFFTTLVGEVVPRAIDARMGATARHRLTALDRLHLTPEHTLVVQRIYEQHADREELARRELRKLAGEQRALFLALDEAQLSLIRDKMASQRAILYEVSSERTLAICRILDEHQRRLFVEMRPAGVSF